MASTYSAMGAGKVLAALGEPPQATLILSLAERPLRRDEIVRALAARGVATTWLRDAALAVALQELISDGTVQHRTHAEGAPGVYALTDPGRDRAGIIEAFFEALAGCAPPGEARGRLPCVVRGEASENP